jgi:hypothetical protein
MKVLLLVTWIIPNQAAHSYQVPFTSMAACEAARTVLDKEVSLLRIAQDAHLARLRQMVTNVAPGPYPQVVAVCVTQ